MKTSSGGSRFSRSSVLTWVVGPHLGQLSVLQGRRTPNFCHCSAVTSVVCLVWRVGSFIVAVPSQRALSEGCRAHGGSQPCL